MYTSIYGKANNLKKDGKIYGVKNNCGSISVIEFDCYKDKKGFFYFKPKGEKKDYYEGMSKEKFCTPSTDRYCTNYNSDISFMNTDKDTLIAKWNEQIEKDKLSNIPIYKINSNIKTFSDILAYAEKLREDGINCESVIICVKGYSDEPIKVWLEEEDGTFYVSHCDDYTSKIKDFVDDYDWDEGYYADATLEELNNYLSAYSIDLARTYFIQYIERTEEELVKYAEDTYGNFDNEHTEIKDAFLMFDLLNGESYKEKVVRPLSSFEPERDYIYELTCAFDEYKIASKSYIVAYKIINETETEWICEDRKFKKVDFVETNKINPFSTNLFYALTPKEVICLYNNNLNKFKI